LKAREAKNSPLMGRQESSEHRFLQAEARYRALVESILAITFIAALDEGKQEFYVSPQIEPILGFTQREWLEIPILWYTQLHPDDQ
jgi:PAS domain-containing protein